MTRYIAFLRGINVGGHKLIKMEELGRIFEDFGLQNVKTIITSGNVLFDCAEKSKTSLARKIEKNLEKRLGYEVDVMLRTFSEMGDMVRQNPFGKIKVHDDIKLYVTFLAGKPVTTLTIPFTSLKKDVQIISMSGGEVFSTTFKLSDGRFGDSATFIEKEFKMRATTRNWNTLKRIVESARQKKHDG